jgi:hypothetical protein
MSLVSVMCCRIEVSVSGRSLVQGSVVCASLSIIRCNSNPLHQEYVRGRDQAKKERKEERKNLFKLNRVYVKRIS